MVHSAALPARRLEAVDLGWATALLEVACADQPVLNYCCTGRAAQLQKAWLLQQLLRYGLCYGRVYANAERNALAVWLQPQSQAATLGRLLRSGMLPAAIWRLRWLGLQRLSQFLRGTTRLRQPTERRAPRHYLLALAVCPVVRGQGRGRRLVQATLAAMQATRTPFYLGTQQADELLFPNGWVSGFLARAWASPNSRAPNIVLN